MLDAELPEKVYGEIPRLTVAVAGEDYVPVRLHESHDHQKDRSHARRIEHRAFRTFDGSKFALGLLLGRIAVTGVFVLAYHLALSLARINSSTSSAVSK
jgi:hypothetical protein